MKMKTMLSKCKMRYISTVEKPVNIKNFSPPGKCYVWVI